MMNELLKRVGIGSVIGLIIGLIVAAGTNVEDFS